MPAHVLGLERNDQRCRISERPVQLVDVQLGPPIAPEVQKREGGVELQFSLCKPFDLYVKVENIV